MTQPRMQVGALTIGAAHPRELAQFYAAMLGWQVAALEGPRPGKPPADGWAQIRPPEGESGPTLNFETEENYRRPVWPSIEGTSRHPAPRHRGGRPGRCRGLGAGEGRGPG